MKSENPLLDHDVDREAASGHSYAHPVGIGLGSVGGGAAGGALGSAGGPVGMFIGALAAGLEEKSPAERIDFAAENQYWRENYRKESYYDGNYTFQDYGPAYRAGYSAKAAGDSQTFEEVEPKLRLSWENINDLSSLTWERARPASRAAWERVERAMRGKSETTGH